MWIARFASEELRENSDNYETSQGYGSELHYQLNSMVPFLAFLKIYIFSPNAWLQIIKWTHFEDLSRKKKQPAKQKPRKPVNNEAKHITKM